MKLRSTCIIITASRLTNSISKYLGLGCRRKVCDGAELPLLVNEDDEEAVLPLLQELVDEDEVVLLADHLGPLVALQLESLEAELLQHLHTRVLHTSPSFISVCHDWGGGSAVIIN